MQGKNRLIIDGTLPGLNELINAERANKHAGAKLKKDAEMIVRHFIRDQLHGVKPKTPVFLDYCFYEPTRRRDKDNIAAFAHKVIQDSLVKERILPNDGWADVAGFMDSFEIDKKRPRIEVTILEGDAE